MCVGYSRLSPLLTFPAAPRTLTTYMSSPCYGQRPLEWWGTLVFLPCTIKIPVNYLGVLLYLFHLSLWLSVSVRKWIQILIGISKTNWRFIFLSCQGILDIWTCKSSRASMVTSCTVLSMSSTPFLFLLHCPQHMSSFYTFHRPHTAAGAPAFTAPFQQEEKGRGRAQKLLPTA